MTLINDFIKYIRYELNLSIHTVLSYKVDLLQFIDFIAPHYVYSETDNDDVDAPDFATVTTNDIRAWIVSLAAKKDSPRTIRRKIQALRALYKFMIKRNLIAESPADEIELAKVRRKLPQYVRTDTMDDYFAEPVEEGRDNYQTLRDRLIVAMLYNTGIRRAEIINLQNANVDMDLCQMKVHGKRDKDRIIPFGIELRDMIIQYIKLRNEKYSYTSTFFVRSDGEPMYPMMVYKIVRSQLQALGVGGKKSPHVLRHSFASAMLNNGADINSVKEILGHESLAATQVYTHITFSELKQNYQQAHPRAVKKGG